MDIKFGEYLEKNVEFFDRLSDEEKKELKALHSAMLKWEEIQSKTMQLALKSKSGVDFTTDYNKAGEEIGRASKNLEAYVSVLRKKYGEGLNL